MHRKLFFIFKPNELAKIGNKKETVSDSWILVLEYFYQTLSFCRFNDIPPIERIALMLYLIPCQLYDGVTETIPAYVLDAVKQCQIFYVENERSARRFLKSLWRDMVIDNYEWHTIHKAEPAVMQQFIRSLQAGKNIGILSEAGCPCIADPGHLLVAKAQHLGFAVKPLVGPSSIVLALMGSGLNGQQFRFNGYLPIDGSARRKALLELEATVQTSSETQLFMETPYRNDQLFKDMLHCLHPETLLCVAADISAATESIVTKPVHLWKSSPPPLHKRPVMFLIGRY